MLLFIQNFPTRQLGLNHIIFWSKFSKKTRWAEPYCLLVKIFLNDNIVFWSQFSEKTKWVEPYCLLVKSFLKDNMD